MHHALQVLLAAEARVEAGRQLLDAGRVVDGQLDLPAHGLRPEPVIRAADVVTWALQHYKCHHPPLLSPHLRRVWWSWRGSGSRSRAWSWPGRAGAGGGGTSSAAAPGSPPAGCTTAAQARLAISLYFLVLFLIYLPSLTTRPSLGDTAMIGFTEIQDFYHDDRMAKRYL